MTAGSVCRAGSGLRRRPLGVLCLEAEEQNLPWFLFGAPVEARHGAVAVLAFRLGEEV